MPQIEQLAKDYLDGKPGVYPHSLEFQAAVDRLYQERLAKLR